MASDAAFITERALYGFAQNDANVFDGVMLIDFEIAASVESKIESAVTCEEFEHVVEKAYACGYSRVAAAIEIQAHADVCLAGLAFDIGGSRHG